LTPRQTDATYIIFWQAGDIRDPFGTIHVVDFDNRPRPDTYPLERLYSGPDGSEIHLGSDCGAYLSVEFDDEVFVIAFTPAGRAFFFERIAAEALASGLKVRADSTVDLPDGFVEAEDAKQE
jgi:hypothetical protein